MRVFIVFTVIRVIFEVLFSNSKTTTFAVWSTLIHNPHRFLRYAGSTQNTVIQLH